MLTASSFVGKRLKKKELTLEIDLKPALTDEQLDHRILRDFEENIRTGSLKMRWGNYFLPS